MITLLQNNTENNHFEHLEAALKASTSINMAIAFFKNSGLNFLFPFFKKAVKKNIPINLVIGIDFGLTEPDALTRIFELFRHSDNANLFIAQSKETFHPKLYFISQKRKHTIICGSANCTKGGYFSNNELSIKVVAKATDKIVKETEAYFLDIVNQDFVKRVSMSDINSYEEFHKEQKKLRTKIKAKPRSIGIDYKSLKKHLIKWKRHVDIEAYHKEKKESYSAAKKNLDLLASSRRMTREEFSYIYDELVGWKGHADERYFYSNGLFRGKTDTVNDFKKYRELVRLIKENQNKSPKDLWTLVKPFKVKQVGENGKAEIMMTYAPEKFPNLNKNPIRSMQEVGCFLKNPSSFNGNDYQEYYFLLKEISEELGLKDMMEVDSFFNNIYRKLEDENRL